MTDSLSLSLLLPLPLPQSGSILFLDLDLCVFAVGLVHLYICIALILPQSKAIHRSPARQYRPRPLPRSGLL
jgi:hypothetical protein